MWGPRVQAGGGKRLSLHSLGINLPLPAVITAKRPIETTPWMPGGCNGPWSQLGTSLMATGQLQKGKGGGGLQILYLFVILCNRSVKVIFVKLHVCQLHRMDIVFAKQETSKNKGRGNLVSLWMHTVLPLSELCWGWESERMGNRCSRRACLGYRAHFC